MYELFACNKNETEKLFFFPQCCLSMNDERRTNKGKFHKSLNVKVFNEIAFIICSVIPEIKAIANEFLCSRIEKKFNSFGMKKKFKIMRKE